MLGLAYRILTNEGGGPRIVFYYGLMHLALSFDRAGFRGVADWVRRAVPLAKIDRACSALLQARFRLLVTELGGCAIDIDNEHDLAVANQRHEEWVARLRQQVAALGMGLPAAAGTGSVERVEANPATAVEDGQ